MDDTRGGANMRLLRCCSAAQHDGRPSGTRTRQQNCPAERERPTPETIQTRARKSCQTRHGHFAVVTQLLAIARLIETRWLSRFWGIVNWLCKLNTRFRTPPLPRTILVQVTPFCKLQPRHGISRELRRRCGAAPRTAGSRLRFPLTELKVQRPQGDEEAQCAT